MRRNLALNFPPGGSPDVEKGMDETGEAISVDPSGAAGADEASLERPRRDEAEAPPSDAASDAHAGAAGDVQTEDTVGGAQPGDANPAPENGVRGAATAPHAESATPHAAQPATRHADAQIQSDCKVHVHRGDAIALMYAHRDIPERYDVVDLDPYGTASPFLDGAVQSVADGGLLCVTCTDLAVLAGHNYPEKCWTLYGGVSVKAEYSHEVALRLVLHAIAQAAGRYGRYVQPMLSLSIDFYLRVFVRVWTRPETVKHNASQTALVYTCSRCSDWHLQPLGRVASVRNEKTGGSHYKFGSAGGPPTGPECSQCGGTFHVGGPMWTGPLHDASFCDAMLAKLDAGDHTLGTETRIRGMVSTARDELVAPFYFHPANVAGLFHCASPALAPVVSALLNAGYKVSRSHCVAGSVKTDASRAAVYDLMRCWIRTNTVKEERLKPNSAAKGLLSKRDADGQPAVSTEFDLDTHNAGADAVIRGANARNASGRLVRYQMNPQANWGPGTAAKGHRTKQRRSFAPDELARRAARPSGVRDGGF